MLLRIGYGTLLYLTFFKILTECRYIHVGADSYFQKWNLWFRKCKSANRGSQRSQTLAEYAAGYGLLGDEININMNADLRTNYSQDCLYENTKYNEKNSQCDPKDCRESCIALKFVTGVCLLPNNGKIYKKCYCEPFKTHI